MYEAETFIVKRFRSLNSNKEITDKHLDLKVQELESFFGIRYNTCQLEAIKKSYTRDFLIITGGPGTGKTTIAKIFAKAINCENPVNGSPCGKCANCQALGEANCPDIFEIDAASNNKVENIREIRDKVQ